MVPLILGNPHIYYQHEAFHGLKFIAIVESPKKSGTLRAVKRLVEGHPPGSDDHQPGLIGTLWGLPGGKVRGTTVSKQNM